MRPVRLCRRPLHSCLARGCHCLELADRPLRECPEERPRFPTLCAICGDRPAAVFDLVDGKKFPVCNGCRDEEVPEPPPPPTTGERVLRVLARMPGADIAEICEAMGETDDMARGRISAALNRAVRAGLATFEGCRMDRTYSVIAPGK